jgi:hypothetical protein
MMCRSTSDLSLLVSMQFYPNYLITMTAHIAHIAWSYPHTQIWCDGWRRYQGSSTHRMSQTRCGRRRRWGQSREIHLLGLPPPPPLPRQSSSCGSSTSHPLQTLCPLFKDSRLTDTVPTVLFPQGMRSIPPGNEIHTILSCPILHRVSDSLPIWRGSNLS